MEIAPQKTFREYISVPPDKSITHRALLFSLLVKGKCIIRNPLISDSTSETIDALKALGLIVEENAGILEITNNGIREGTTVNCGGSATLMRLLTGILAARSDAVLICGQSLSRRPMDRIVNPLSKMGAKITSDCGKPPLIINKSGLIGKRLSFKSPSAQVKSTVLLAGLSAEGKTSVSEPVETRNHTELLLKEMGANISCRFNNGRYEASVEKSELQPFDITVPGDFSSAMYPLALYALNKKPLVLMNIGLNPTRTHMLGLLGRMGIKTETEMVGTYGQEPYGNIVLKEIGEIRPVEISSEEAPFVIDEFPILAVLAANANGISVFNGISELSAKESNRIKTIISMINSAGGSSHYDGERIIIEGKGGLQGGTINSYGDHRIALAGAVALASGKYGGNLEGAEDALISYPGFYKIFT